MKHSGQPLSIVIFGGTGDLAEKKLLPALFDLYQSDCLPQQFSIIGFSRKDLSNEQYRSFTQDALTAKGKTGCEGFLQHVFYKQGDITTAASYQSLNEYLQAKDDQLGLCTNKMFHLSVPPRLYEPVFQHVAASGLTTPCAENSDANWTRVLVEKPFGNNKDEAERLDMMLGELFEESQIFRIDHYVAKESIQNLITFRFANALFEPLWNNQAIEKIEVRLHEAFGVRDRGASYDGVGALRDVGQNHLLQMLALITMNDPQSMDADAVRNARADVLDNLIPYTDDGQYAWRAQYNGYRDTDGVDEDSDTETYFKIALELDDTRWKGVPLYLESGKALDQSLTEIVVTFKHQESCVCPQDTDTTHYQNKIIFRIQPHEGITVNFWVKRPGFNYELDEKKLSFDYETSEESIRLPDAYERVLHDCIVGDQTLFISTREIQAQWSLIMKILDDWQQTPLLHYEQGVRAASIINDNK